MDEDQFSPEKDTFLDQQYSWNNIDSKAKNKIYLQKNVLKKRIRMCRLSALCTGWQGKKGIDLMMDIFPELLWEKIFSLSCSELDGAEL